MYMLAPIRESSEKQVRIARTLNDIEGKLHDKIIKYICFEQGISETTMKSEIRHKAILEARQVAMYVIKQNTSLSVEKVGALFGKNHATVINAINKINRMIEIKDPMGRYAIETNDVFKKAR